MPVTINGSNGVTFPDSTLQSSAAPGGGTTTTSAVDITLTNTSKQAQDITMTASGKFVTLPSATTLTPGANLFQIYNDNGLPFSIRDGANNVIVSNLGAGQSVSLSLLTNSTTAGIWVVGGNEAFGGFGPVSTSTINFSNNATSFTYLGQVVGLSATAAFIAYNGFDGVARAVIATISGTTVTYGTPIVLDSMFNPSGISNPYINFTALSSTLVVGTSNTSGTALIAFSISGTTITQGSQALPDGSTSVATYLFPLTATTGVLVLTGSGGTKARAFSVSGTTITLGTSVTVSANATGSSTAVKVASNKIVLLYADVGTTGFSARAFTVSGTTITQGTAVSVPSIFGAELNLRLYAQCLSPATDIAVIFAQGFFISLNLSGTTITVRSSGGYEPKVSANKFYSWGAAYQANLGQNTITQNISNINYMIGAMDISFINSQYGVPFGLCKVVSDGDFFSQIPITPFANLGTFFGLTQLDANTLLVTTVRSGAAGNSLTNLASIVVKVK